MTKWSEYVLNCSLLIRAKRKSVFGQVRVMHLKADFVVGRNSPRTGQGDILKFRPEGTLYAEVF
jgi:hypothetical protein